MLQWFFKLHGDSQRKLVYIISFVHKMEWTHNAGSICFLFLQSVKARGAALQPLPRLPAACSSLHRLKKSFRKGSCAVSVGKSFLFKTLAF